MLIGGILLGLFLGLWVGGSIANLASVRLRWVPLLVVAVILRFGTEAALSADLGPVDALRLPLLLGSFAILMAGLWVNRGYPGMSLALIGIAANAIVIGLNGGYMPIWDVALRAAGLTPEDVTSALHMVVAATPETYIGNALVLGDILPIPLPFYRNVASLGDVFLTIGLGFFLFASVVRVPTPLEASEEAAIRRRLRGLPGVARPPRPGQPDTGAGVGAGVDRSATGTAGATAIAPETGLTPALRDSAALERPVFLGSETTSAALTSPALAPLPPADAASMGHTLSALDAAALERAFEAGGVTIEATQAGVRTTTVASGTSTAPGQAAPRTAEPGTAPTITLPRPSPETLARVRRHPYVRLALNGSFTALWSGQLVSLFGDRLHQAALAIAVLITTGSELASSLVIAIAFVPNLIFSPIAGTFVDRWDNKEVLIVSDILRAATVLLIPVAVTTNILLVYPFVFLMTTISIFFRPARVAILPRIVEKDELVTANSSLWLGETIADVIGFPLAGLFVLALGNAIPIAFWLDAATYIASAALLSTLIIREPEPESESEPESEPEPEQDGLDAAVAPKSHGTTEVAVDAQAPKGAVATFMEELREGYRFLREEPILFANTIQASVAQLTVGILTSLTPAFVFTIFQDHEIGWQAIYPLIESSIGIGNLVGGFVLGLIGARIAKGRMISVGYVVWGALTVVFALTGDLGLVLGAAFGSGIANMAFVIPSQALFQERTPAELMGRVVSFRFALVFGAMSIAMLTGGVLASVIGVTTVIAVFGIVSVGAGIAGFLVPAIRDAA